MNDATPEHTTGRREWWGTYPLEAGKSAHWCIDSLRLWILRTEQEWQVGATAADDAEEGWRFEPDAAMPADEELLQRHVFTRTHGPLTLAPVVADRPMVAAPRIPLFIPPAEATTVYVGSPLWLRIDVEEPGKLLAEMPIRRPSDTWFGPNTREGELCYATRTRAIVDPAHLTTLSRRAITPVVIRNDGEESLPVERLKLPVPYLPLYADGGGQLWTPTVTMVGQQEVGMASFEMETTAPEGIDARLITPAREEPEPGLLIRAFSMFRSLDS